MSGIAAVHVWLDGRLQPSEGPHLSVYDRGFQIGDGVFEALRARRGVVIELDGHLARLHQGLAGMDIELPFDDEAIRTGIEDLLAAEGWDGVEPIEPGNAVIRITVSRGFDPSRGVAPNATRPTVAIQAWPYKAPSERVLTEGERVVTSCIKRVPDSPMGPIKSTSRADLVYARIEARRAGADDAIFVTIDGCVAEATTSNVLAIHGRECATPRLGGALLAGTTRAWLVGHGADVGLTMTERDIPLDEVRAADELAVCSAIAGVVPVTSLDGRPIGSGRPGPLTAALRQAREDWIDRLSIEGARGRPAR
jgi:branched-subunit amino acid aminotransferase/4-amino-4-deoxychorismate lyase